MLSAAAECPLLWRLALAMWQRVTGAQAQAVDAASLARDLRALPVEQQAEWTLAMLAAGWRATAHRAFEEQQRWSRWLH